MFYDGNIIYTLVIEVMVMPGMVVHACNLSTLEAEAGELWVRGQSGLWRETPSLTNKDVHWEFAALSRLCQDLCQRSRLVPTLLLFFFLPFLFPFSCVWVYAYVCMCVHVSLCVCMYMRTHVCFSLCVYTCVDIRLMSESSSFTPLPYSMRQGLLVKPRAHWYNEPH